MKEFGQGRPTIEVADIGNMLTNELNGVRFTIGGDISFEANGSSEFIERERSVFVDHILPVAMEMASALSPWTVQPKQ